MIKLLTLTFIIGLLPAIASATPKKIEMIYLSSLLPENGGKEKSVKI